MKHFGDRLVGGKFQGSSSADFSSGVVDLFTVTEAPPDGELTIQAGTAKASTTAIAIAIPNAARGTAGHRRGTGDAESRGARAHD